MNYLLMTLKCTANFLALNPSKTEFMLFGTPQQLVKLNDVCLSISPDISITPASSVKNLGVVFDKHLSFHEHITKISQACFFHIRDLRRTRPYLTQETAATIIALLSCNPSWTTAIGPSTKSKNNI